MVYGKGEVFAEEAQALTHTPPGNSSFHWLCPWKQLQLILPIGQPCSVQEVQSNIMQVQRLNGAPVIVYLECSEPLQGTNLSPGTFT